MSESQKPPHHLPDGTFRNPWQDGPPSGTPGMMLKWTWQRMRHGLPAAPAPESFPLAVPDIALPRAPVQQCRITWLGQSGFLLQLGGLNLLLDPVLSKRASPLSMMGPARIPAAPLRVADLPPIDAVLISHDHYDHLDARTIAQLIERFGAALQFITPLGYTRWFENLGTSSVRVLDWWQSMQFTNDVAFTCLPAQHWTRRGFDTARRLWCSWLLRAPQRSVYFCGDSGYCPVFREIRDRVGAPDIALLPIGAYEPRWFMKRAHMNPEEAVQTFLDLGAHDFVAMHWGTFRLTDEPMLEPPLRTRAAWHDHHLPDEQLHIPRHGQTITW